MDSKKSHRGRGGSHLWNRSWWVKTTIITISIHPWIGLQESCPSWRVASGEWRGPPSISCLPIAVQLPFHKLKKNDSWMWKLGVCKSAWWQDLPTHQVERSRWVFGLGLPVSSMLFLFSLVNFWRLCCLYAVELVVSESEHWVSRSFCRVLCDCEQNRHRGNHSSTSHTCFKPSNWDVCSFLVSVFTHWLTLANHG